jgi:nitrite reductase/ring-hydroxylating ferredoxin subunit
MSLLGFLDRIADAPTFDEVIGPSRRAVQAALPRPVRDFLHGTWLGHPLHPVMMHIPVGTWMSAGVLDLVPRLRPAGTVLIGTGVAAAVPTALAGAVDWSEQGIGVQRLGVLHAAANTVALSLYAGALVARVKGRGTLGLVLSYAGLGVATGSAAIGGHMSYAQSSGVSHASTAAKALTADWIDLGPLDDLPEGRPALRTGGSDSAAVPLTAVRRGARVDVFVARCSHLSGPLHEGTVEQIRGSACLVCPWHGSAFDLETGEPRRGPTANLQEKLEVRMEAGRVMARVSSRHR